jgi:TRAP-type C4-dicarboxylate transport system substrate-binding protein
LVGATVVTERAWRRLEERDGAAISGAARRAQERLQREIPDQDGQAVREMSDRGLEVTAAIDEEGWRALAEQFVGVTAEGQIPRDVLDRALAARARYRSQGAVKESP